MRRKNCTSGRRTILPVRGGIFGCILSAALASGLPMTAFGGPAADIQAAAEASEDSAAGQTEEAGQTSQAAEQAEAAGGTAQTADQAEAADGTAQAAGQTGWLSEGDNWYYLDETGAMATGFRRIDGKYYYFRSDGTMQTSTLTQDDTQYSFRADGSLDSARQRKNRGGGSYPIAFYDEETQAMADCLNELKADAFDGDEEEDYYEDDKKNYDKDASFIINGKLQEIAERRLSLARSRGYGSGRIPDEGELKDTVKAMGYESGRRMMEVYLLNCEGATHAEEKLLRNHDSDEKTRSDRAIYYKEVGIAHETVNGRDYYMIVFMR